MAEGDEINVKIGAQNQGLLSGLKQAEDAITHSSGYIRASLSGLTDVVERIKLPFVELAAVLAGGAAFRAFVDGTEQLGLELEKASAKTGIAVEDLAGLKFAADQVDVSFDSLVTSSQRLSLAIQQQNEGATSPGTKALSALGISAKEATGNTKPLEEIILEVADRFKDFKDGADKTALAMNLFGRAGAEMIPFLNEGRDGIEAAKNEATQMGAVMSGQAVQAAEEFHQSMGRVGLAGQSLKITIGTALMPALTMAANALADSAKEGGLLHTTIEALKIPIQIMGTVFVTVVAAIQQGFDTLMLAIRVFEAGIVGMSLLISDLRTGQFSKMKDDWVIATTNMRTAFTDWSTDIRHSALETAKAVQGIWGAGSDGPSPAKKQNAPQVAPKDPKDWLAKQREAWDLEKQESKNVSDALLQEEIKFWEARLTDANASAKDLRAIEATLTAARLRLAGDTRRAAMIETQITRDAQLEQLDIEKQSIEQKRSSREIDANQAAAQLKELARQELAIKLEQLAAERALAEGDLVKQAEIDARIAAAKRAAGKEIATIDKQTTLSIKAEWDKLFSSITNAFDQSVNGIIQGTTTMSAALKNIWKSITAEVVSSLVKTLIAHKATELAKTGATVQGTAQRVALEEWAAVKSAAASAWQAIVQIGQYAVSGAAAAFASIAAIPIIGPALAPAAAAAAGIAILGFAGHVASAEGGYDVPRGLNPMTQLHQNEMVLPAELANKVRHMTDGSAGSGAGGLHVHVHAMDAKSVKQFFVKHKDHLVSVLNGETRNFAFDEG